MEVADGGEKIGVGDLLIGSVGFALLQRWGRRNTERQIREGDGEETVWDVVILDNGVRADVIGTQQVGYANPAQDTFDSESRRPASFLSPGRDEETFDAVEREQASAAVLRHPHLDLSAESQHQLSDEEIRRYIMSQLPQGCRASIKTETITARTITVDIFDDDTEIAAPPGTMLVEERFHHDPSYRPNESSFITQPVPKHTVVFRTAFNRSQSADLRREECAPPVLSGSETAEECPSVEDIDDSNIRHTSAIGIRNTKHASRKTSLGASITDPNDRSSSPAFGASDYHEQDMGKERFATQPYSEERNTESNTSKHIVHKRPRHTLSSSSLSSSEKATFGKKSFSKIAQKVKSASEEKLENKKKVPVKSGSKGRTRRSSSSVQKKEKESKDSGTEKASATQGLFRKTMSRAKHSPSANHTSEPRIPSPSASRSKPQPRLPASPTIRSPPSPTARRHHARDIQGRTPSRSDYYSVREKNRESFIAQTDSYSVRSLDARPGSSLAKTHLRSSSAMSANMSEKDMKVSVDGDIRPGSSAIHRRSGSFAPSIYSLATAGSQASLILAPRPRKSVYEDQDTLIELGRNGTVPGIFPANHLVHNIRRFCRFASASYGSNALKVMGISEVTKVVRSMHSDHHEHNSFSDHTGLPPSTILLSSFVDPEGGSNSKGETGTGFPLVHYLSIDHESKAIVLTLRGTWGFEDILTDMTCDYDDLEWQGKNWKVHKGMLASARRLLEGGGGRVMVTMKAALEEFTDYGVIFCGHSLGGGVASLLATLISEPNTDSTGPSFVTASSLSAVRPLLLTVGQQEPAHMAYSLPSGRPIHVYAYGPPAVMSPFLRRATRGLITTVVNGQDVVPSLSLGILHDVHAVAQAFKTDTSGAKSHIRSRVWEALRQSIVNKFYVNQPPIIVNAGEGVGDDTWSWAALKTLRAEMVAPKLVPPGEVFVVETMRVLQRDAFASNPTNDGYTRLGRPATRVQFKFIRNVEALFGELRFDSSMLGDHNPARYEASLAALASGALDD